MSEYLKFLRFNNDRGIITNRRSILLKDFEIDDVFDNKADFSEE